MPHDADVAIIGLGIMGSCLAWQLSARGVGVVAIDRYAPPHAIGSSQGETRMSRRALWESPLYMPLVRRSEELWPELSAHGDTDLFTRTGALIIGKADDPFIRQSVVTLKAFGEPFTIMGKAEVAARYPQHALEDGEIALFDPAGGILRAEPAVRAAMNAARAAGAELILNTTVTGLTPLPDGVLIQTAGRSFKARKAVIAVGAWAKTILSEMNALIKCERHEYAWFGLNADPADYTTERFPPYIRGRRLYGFPSLDGKTVKIALGTSEEVPSADSFDRTVEDDHLRKWAAQAAYPVLPGIGDVDPGSGRSCLYSNSPDNHFIVSPTHYSDDIWIMAGFSGHGFKHAPAMAEAAAELIRSGQTGMPMEAFDLKRFSASIGTARM
jgi:sarcosine oxidase